MIKESINTKYISKFDVQNYKCKICNKLIDGHSFIYTLTDTDKKYGVFWVFCSGDCLIYFIRDIDVNKYAENLQSLVYSGTDPLNIHGSYMVRKIFKVPVVSRENF